MSDTTARILFEKLTAKFPVPWNLVYHEKEAGHERQYVSEVVSMDGESVMKLETYSGDGDLFNLGSEGAEALVEFVNSMHEHAT